MAKELIGLMVCPECGHADAQISETKAGLAMRFCPGCYAQYFPKKTPPSLALIAKARPGTATGRHVKPVQEPEPQPAPARTAPPVQEQQHQQQPAPSRAITMPGF